MIHFIINNYELYLANVILLTLAFFAKAKMDISAKDGFTDNLVKRNKSYSWVNKYDSSFKTYKKPPLHYLWLFKPTHVERFPYSSTFLVFLTDYWHRMQFIFLNCMFLALSLNISCDFKTLIINFLLIRFIYSLVFNITYK